tara:strand:+ start:109 stop:786 length:678 start_codon:yes stop_codon:yes gene_type:complete
MDYSTLFETIQGYAENTFPSTSVNDTSAVATTFTGKEQIDTFIQQAEQRIYNVVQLPDLRKNVTGTFSAGSKYLGIPIDWLSTFSLAVIAADGSQTFLLNKDVNFIRESFPNPAATGVPTHYAIFDDNSFIVGPTPNLSYAAELHYFYYPDSIVTAGTSWLGNEFSSVLLYGALLEAATFMKAEADELANYQKRYDEALGLLKMLGDAKNRQDMYRTPQVRYPVK